uniref:Ligand of Numb protein X 2-like n=2 Tax=Hirondellea gigas TaxID=1518452 RepID=A0A6A7FP33_9CRUS
MSDDAAPSQAVSSSSSPQTYAANTSSSSASRVPAKRRLCRTCGQAHFGNEPHLYDYIDDVDEDVSCHICLQPLVTPVDTPCGHTFCRPCLLTYLRVQPMCPVDRRPLTHQLCTPSSLVLRKLLEKLIVRCPNTTQCEITLQRGDLEDHLKYRCPGNWVGCPHAASGCDVRGPQKTITTHAPLCPHKDAGREKSGIKEGEVSHIEISRSQVALGITIVGGSDTPLRCVVVQEVFPDGLIAHDGRLQSGDQIIEVDGVDMTSATHAHVCQELKKFTQPTLQLGVYRERIQAYPTSGSPSNDNTASVTSLNSTAEMCQVVTLWRESGRQLGIKLGGRHNQPGIFILEILNGSVAYNDGRLKPHDRILAINGNDVRYARLDVASRLIQRSGTTSVSLVLCSSTVGNYNHLFQQPNSSTDVSHSRTKSAPEPSLERLDLSTKEFIKSNDDMSECYNNNYSLNEDGSRSCESLSNQPNNLATNGNGALNTHLRYKQDNGSVGSLSGFDNQPYQQSIGSLGSISSPLNKSNGSISGVQQSNQFESSSSDNLIVPVLPPRSRLPMGRTHSNDPLTEESATSEEILESPRNQPEDVVDGQVSSRIKTRRSKDSSDLTDLACGFRKSLKLDGATLQQKTVTISKTSNESLGMRIGGGVASNEGDTPIYIANINPHGPVGKSNNVKKGDVLLSVNGQSLLGLTHGQAVAQLKATAELAGVTLSLLDGPETAATNSANFVPSWLYWQKLPRPLQISRSVVLQRSPGSSLGFSIVGGTDPSRGSEPIHVLLVVASSPAAVDGKLRCGDRILAVDNYSLESVSHSTAVGLLKQAGQRVHLEVVSWLGTEL